MEFRVLGPLEVVEGGRVVQLGSGRQLALVALLLLHANEAVSVDRVVDELWGESPPPTAAKIVRNSVSVLRKELGDRLVTQPPGYLLRVEARELDSDRLERAIESGDVQSLTDALALWRGAPLSQVAFEPFAQVEIARLEELRLVALETRAEAQLALGRHASAVPELEALVHQHPLRERLCGLLMLALYRSGRQAEALEIYRRTRRTLDEQLGIEPSPELRELERKILNQDQSLGAPVSPSTEREDRGPQRRAVVLVAAAVVLAAVAAAFLLTRDSSGGLAGVPPNYVGVIDPENDEIVAAVPVGIRPGPVAPGGGSIWIGNLQDRNLTRIDLERLAPVGDVSLGDRTPNALAVGAAAVWVVHGVRGELSRVDAQFGRVTRTIQVTSRPNAAADAGVSVASRHVWTVYGDSSLTRIDRATMRLAESAITGALPSAVLAQERAVWVVNAGDATVQRFDPVTFAEGPVRQISVGRRPAGLAFGAGALWVANRGDDSVTRIDPSTSSTLTIRVGDEPGAVAVGAGAVWVANSGDGTVSRIDPDSNDVDRTIDVGNAPAGIAVAGGLVWVAVQAR
jgi:YVTN family beta-propeller protein